MPAVQEAIAFMYMDNLHESIVNECYTELFRKANTENCIRNFLPQFAISSGL